VANPVHKEEDDGETALDTVEPERIVNRDSMTPYDESICLSQGYDLIRAGKVGVVILAGG